MHFPLNSRHRERRHGDGAGRECSEHDLDSLGLFPVIDDFRLASIKGIAKCLRPGDANSAAESGELDRTLDGLRPGVNGQKRAGLFVL